MSTEEKAENICRSIGIAMYVQKEDADMQKENRVGTRKEAGRRKPVKKTKGYAREAGTKAEKRTVKKRKDPYMHSLKRRCALLAALALVLGGMVVARPYLKRYTVPVGGRTITDNSSYITDASGLPVQNPLILVNKANPLPDEAMRWICTG